MSQSDDLKEGLEALDGLFSKFDVRKGDLLSLVFKLAIDGGHLMPPAPRGAPPHTPFDNISIWARMQKVRDDGPKKNNGEPKLTEGIAGRKARVSKSALGRAKKCVITQAIISSRKLMGADEFWKSVWVEPAPEDGPPGFFWDVAVRGKEWTPGFKRYVASGAFRGPTLLASAQKTSR